jgi:hypothetical protein
MTKKPRLRGAFSPNGADYFVEPEPLAPTDAPLGEVPAPTVEPDGFIAPLALLFTAPEVPAALVPEPVMPAEEPLVVLGVDAPVLPAPAPPLVWAKARVDDMARAEASAMVAIFMMTAFRFDTSAIHACLHRSGSGVTTS